MLLLDFSGYIFLFYLDRLFFDRLKKIKKNLKDMPGEFVHAV